MLLSICELSENVAFKMLCVYRGTVWQFESKKKKRKRLGAG
jgi:hypothetical protein